jgi:citronellol/citronellal dehydrogenase
MERIVLVKNALASANPETNPNPIFSSKESLKGKTLLITGASRGIGLAIATRAAKDGANIVILAKTTEEHPTLPGTIFTAAKEIEANGGKALPIKCDIRFEESVKKAVEEAVKTFGGIDILVNNASAIYLKGTMDTDMKKYDLLYALIVRGTFLVTKYCLPHLLKSKNPYIMNITQPLDISPQRFYKHPAYNLAKQSMSIMVLGWAEEFKDKIVVVGLWPATGIATAALNPFGGEIVKKYCRKETIMGDSAYILLTLKDKNISGKTFFDEDVLKKSGVTDFSIYKYDPSVSEEEIKYAKVLDLQSIKKK